MTYLAAGIGGFVLGILFMVILNSMHHARFYDEMIDMKRQLKEIDDACEI